MLHITDGESVAGTLRGSAIPGDVSVYGDLTYEGRCRTWPRRERLKGSPASADDSVVRSFTLVPPWPELIERPGQSESSASQAGTGEFEVVLGKRQAAGLAFLALVLVAACSGGSYLVGRSTALPERQSSLDPAEIPRPSPMVLPAAEAPTLQEAPLFDTPMKGPIYIQLGAVDKSIATVLVHGVRKLGYSAFATEGETRGVFRVLAGPFDSAEEYEATRAAFTELGLDNFSRSYQER